MADTDYVYDQGWAEERARLAGIEALWDDGTREALLRSGVRAGAAVLEVGAGGGSVAQWLADEVGPTGRVLAVDIDTRFIEPLASPTVEVRRADVVTDDLPQGEFDVVHARLLLEHLSGREAALDRLVGALRPGGCLVIEDYDWTAFGFDSGTDIELRATSAILEFMGQAGFEQTYGRRVVGSLAERGLADVAGRGRSLIIDTTHPGYAFFQLSFEQLAPAVIEAGLLAEDDAAEVRERMAAGEYRIVTPTLIATSGRRRGPAT